MKREIEKVTVEFTNGEETVYTGGEKNGVVVAMTEDKGDGTQLEFMMQASGNAIAAVAESCLERLKKYAPMLYVGLMARMAGADDPMELMRRALSSDSGDADDADDIPGLADIDEVL